MRGKITEEEGVSVKSEVDFLSLSLSLSQEVKVKVSLHIQVSIRSPLPRHARLLLCPQQGRPVPARISGAWSRPRNAWGPCSASACQLSLPLLCLHASLLVDINNRERDRERKRRRRRRNVLELEKTLKRTKGKRNRIRRCWLSSVNEERKRCLSSHIKPAWT